MALKVLSAVKHRHFMKQLTNVSITRTFETSAANAARVRKNWKYLSQDCEKRTHEVLIGQRKFNNTFIPHNFRANISELFKFFPLSPERVEIILTESPEILHYDAAKVIEMIQILVDAGDYDIITQEEALLCLARCPDILNIDALAFKRKLTNLFGVTANYDIPWNVVIVSSPMSLLGSVEEMGIIAERLTKWFTDDRVRDVIGNNPTIFEMAWEELDEKLRYLQYTMNVSAYRIAMTPKSLTHDLEFFRLRFEFLSRSGNYRHPDPGAKSAVPTEASPLLHLITDTEDERFIHKCCPGMTMEEFNVFKTLIVLDSLEEVEEEEEELPGDINTYTVPTKTLGKIKRDPPNRYRNK